MKIIHSVLLAATSACLVLTTASCSAQSGPAYQAVFAKATDGAPQAPPGSLKADFQRAAQASSLAEARDRWERFLSTHTPKGGEYEDGFQKLHIDTARYELMRIYYLLGMTASGDKLLREMDPLGLKQ